jgi:hypothetical protein
MDGRMRRWLPALALVMVFCPRAVSGQAADTSIAIAPRMAAGPPCVQDRSQLVDGLKRESMGPSALQMIIPPMENMPRIRNPVDVLMHVTVEGVVDSVVVTGIADSAYAARVRQSSFGMRFRPARRNGCLIADWFRVTFTFPDRR